MCQAHSCMADNGTPGAGQPSPLLWNIAYSRLREAGKADQPAASDVAAWDGPHLSFSSTHLVWASKEMKLQIQIVQKPENLAQFHMQSKYWNFL